ncbi:MAG: tetratricopeptide repeat protein [Planctomycetes bacterium]|nr:tetratricopeptide repeat protein [Planctomycetota bacterium]
MSTPCRSVALSLILLLAGAALHAQTAQENLAAARKALKAREWDEAVLSAKAVLSSDPGNQEAHFILSEAYAGDGQDDEALLAAIDAYDAPRRGLRAASGWAGKARKRIKSLSPTLDEFLGLRGDAAGALMKQRKSADKAKRQYDVEWIEMVAFRVAPTEDVVLKDTGRRSEEYWRLRGHGGSKPKLESGYVRLLEEPKSWVFIDEGPGSKKDEQQIVLCRHPKGYIPMVVLDKDDLRTGERFALRYSVKWTPLKENPNGYKPRLYCFFLPKSRPGPTDKGVSITPTDPGAKVSFIHGEEDHSLRPTAEEKLKFELVKPDQWIDVEIRWAGKGSVLKVLIDDDVKLTTTPNEHDPLNMYIGFGFGDVEEGVIRNPRLNARRPK